LASPVEPTASRRLVRLKFAGFDVLKRAMPTFAGMSSFIVVSPVAVVAEPAGYALALKAPVQPPPPLLTARKWPRAGMIVLFGMVKTTLPLLRARAKPVEPSSAWMVTVELLSL
jgi:hypothetical protein